MGGGDQSIKIPRNDTGDRINQQRHLNSSYDDIPYVQETGRKIKCVK